MLAEFIRRLFGGKKYPDLVSKSKTTKENFSQELKALKNHRNLNFGDYELIYFKHDWRQEEKQKLVDLLQEVKNYSKHLPTVGVELAYSTKLPKEFIDHLNYGKYSVPNTVRKSEASFHVSEIRPLPTNPYSFRWLLEDIGRFLPSDSSSILVNVGKVNDARAPYIFLALYFLYPTCVFPMQQSKHGDHIGFPGAYIGQSVNFRGDLVFRAQTNYLITHSNDINEIADSCFYAAQLHSISDEEFTEFEEELRKVLGFQNRRQMINGEIWIREKEELGDLLKKEWPMKTKDNRCPYQLPQEFVQKSIEKARENLKISHLTKNIYNLDENAGKELRAVNEKVKKVIERYLHITSEDIIYRTTLENALKSVK
ncbi:hypothetical protein HZA97_00285 [Candidatus Woesearchaeota archaeon]|nr:hypothetical protein [Candidatus Woesearchaeota archaeon]